MSRHPARDTKKARNSRRGTWYGHGQTTTVEKDGVGRFIDDVVYTFADVSLVSMPLLVFVAISANTTHFGVKNSAMIAWVTMVVGAAMIRGGWVMPLGTDVPGWVSLSPSLVLLRLCYYNLALALAAYGGGAIAETLSLPLISVLFTFLFAAIAIGVFPRVADEFYRHVSDST
ncbi:hypothetical protein ACFFQF_05065 [Haladaptatus pallidirubidus]|uniref:DUF8215 domain-containing protein n=1 Tax=Haladaptatus pallidirubidus TaxID=1008152 RepID=A0AAV3ULG8_9EURY|nr:hypothetical protein [Haladaptatus pallidirubidus]